MDALTYLFTLLVVGVTSKHVLGTPVVEHGSLIVTYNKLDKYHISTLALDY
jgi:hypothetical protein